MSEQRLTDVDILLADIERTVEESGCVNHEGEIMDCIRYAPIIEAVPVVRGEWVDVYDGTYRKRRCSLCGRDYMMILDYNFCPNCGADMRANP